LLFFQNRRVVLPDQHVFEHGGIGDQQRWWLGTEQGSGQDFIRYLRLGMGFDDFGSIAVVQAKTQGIAKLVRLGA